MSSDFDYSVKFPTLPFYKSTVEDDDSILHKRRPRRSSESESDDGNDAIASPENVSDKEPVILLLGWLGCKETHLSKYENIYYQNGCVVIQYIPIADDLFFNQTRVHDHAGKLLELLDEMTLLDNPIFIHLFSNGGAIMYINMLEQLQANKEFQNTIKIAGVIWDSAPGKPRITSGKNAYLAQMPNVSGILRTVVGIVFVIVLFFVSIYGTFASIFDRKRNPNFYKRLKSNILPCPHLFMYSKCDDIIYFKDIEEMITTIKKSGSPVTTLSWEDSPHVQHFRQHPNSYAKQSIHFIQSCVSP